MNNYILKNKTNDFLKYRPLKQKSKTPDKIDKTIRSLEEHYELTNNIKHEIVALLTIIEKFPKDMPIINVMIKLNKLFKVYEANIDVIKKLNMNNNDKIIKDNIMNHLNDFYMTNKKRFIVLNKNIYEHDLDILLGVFFTFINLCNIIPEHKDFWNMVKKTYNNIIKLIENDIDNHVVSIGDNVQEFNVWLKITLSKWDIDELLQKYKIYMMENRENLSKCIITKLIRENITISNKCLKDLDQLINKNIKSYEVIKTLCESLNNKYQDMINFTF